MKIIKIIKMIKIIKKGKKNQTRINAKISWRTMTHKFQVDKENCRKSSNHLKKSVNKSKNKSKYKSVNTNPCFWKNI